MSSQTTPRLTASSGLVPALASGMIVLIGAIAMLGWILDIPALQSVIPGLVNIKANTALCFIALGASLWLLCDEKPSPRATLAVRILSGAAIIVGALTLCEYIFAVDLRIDQLLFLDSK